MRCRVPAGCVVTTLLLPACLLAAAPARSAPTAEEIRRSNLGLPTGEDPNATGEVDPADSQSASPEAPTTGASAGGEATPDPLPGIFTPTDGSPLRVYPQQVRLRGGVGPGGDRTLAFSLQLWQKPDPNQAQLDLLHWLSLWPLWGQSPPLQPAQVRVELLQLIDKERGHHVPASTRLTVSPSTGLRAEGGVATLPVQLSLQDVRSGRYGGYLLVSAFPSADPEGLRVHEPVAVPLVLEVRDMPWAALTLLAIFTALTLSLDFYQAHRREMDNAYARAADVARLVRDDEALVDPQGPGAPFRLRLRNYLQEAVASIRVALYGRATEALGNADLLWVKWRADRETWLVGLHAVTDERKALAAYADPAAPEATHRPALERRLLDCYHHAPDAASATAFRAEAEGVIHASSRYRRIKERLNAATADLNRVVDPATRTELLARLNTLEASWESADPSAADAETRISALAQEVLTGIDALLAEGGIPAAEAAPEAFPSVSLLERWQERQRREELTQDLLPASLRGRIAAAQLSRRLYATAAGTVVFLGVLLLGLRETYLDNPIFGADPWADYLGLAAWALGADLARRATQAALTSALAGRWSFPSLRRGEAPGGGTAAPGEAPSPQAEPADGEDPLVPDVPPPSGSPAGAGSPLGGGAGESPDEEVGSPERIRAVRGKLGGDGRAS